MSQSPAPTLALTRPFGARYAFVVVAVVFTCLLVSAGVRGAPGVLIIPWQNSFGWSRATVSLAAAIGILLYGLCGPFAAAFIQRFGVRHVTMTAFAVLALSIFASSFMHAAWQLMLTWGVLSGLATGCVANVLGAIVATRWFTSQRGLVMGILTASTATGTLIFTPVLSTIAVSDGWRPVVLIIAAAAALMIPVIGFLLPERPASIGLLPWGAKPGTVPPAPPVTSLFGQAFGGLMLGVKNRTFWLLFASFYICGFTTNGLVGVHMIALCADHGIPETRAAGLLAMMGVFDLIGTTMSGWLTDRFDSRKLLFMYYALRGLALMYLPYSGFGVYGLAAFGVFFGLDWIATVPPTVRLATETFGDHRMPIIFGWIVAGHQIGAASAAFLAGLSRSLEGSYLPAFLFAGMLGVVAAFLSIFIGNADRRAAQRLA
ncbi:MFS transporter [Acidisoma silvae]|uniref:MFS transporter n=1 Tax=Acidisoma silvae TaxID=2802396 RepID=A0A964E0H1_9PROT|nr:MFS transporter [Acidisoma silvae]MCB8876708.1 MFS transporter [Acidisoma silvae]